MSLRKKRLEKFITVIGIVILFFLQFLLHRGVPFMMDDLWYSTNLATDELLQNFGDVVESQIWHFYNWGGRNITHGILQLTLMAGELAADCMNVAMTLLLSYLVCLLAGNKHPMCFLAAGSMMLALNANVKMSMFWQAGAVNYVYSTVWIFLFLWVFLRELEEDAEKLPLVTVWILPLGIMTGWSNENMGPAVFLAACGVTAYLVLWKKKKVKAWMLEGIVTSLVGSIMVVIAPGNFVRSAAIEQQGIGEEIFNHIYSMLCATTEYLFPVLLLMAAILFVYIVCMKGQLRPIQIGLLLTGILAHGAMLLSPHYPDRATFGVMMIGIVLILSLCEDMIKKNRMVKPYLVSAMVCLWVYAIYITGGYLLLEVLSVAGN